MTNRQEALERPKSRREREHAELLEAALARPGIREVMEVHGAWQKRDRGLDAYRRAIKKPERIVITNSPNSC